MESDFDTHLTPTYLVKSDPSEPSYPSVIRLTSDLSSSSIALGHAPPPVPGRGFIRTRAIPCGHGHAHGGGRRDDALGGFGNGYLLLMDNMDGIC